MEQFYTLETASLVLKFDRRSGSLCSLYSKASDWEILNRPHLALSWRLMLPLEDHGGRGGHGQYEPEDASQESVHGRIRIGNR